MEQQQEEWKQYNSTPYYVSNQGRVKRPYKNGDEKYLNPCVNKKRYLWIDLVRKPPRVR